ncbi:unnamed protein product [Nezara viridula]|uniref:Uncharacterized protein n=1 Tax=Nezara viridula TaxID=85310 RepID=A0A9P0E6Z4_NEZVI|nr:unnamed protein product [Nezara viridula]
MRLHDYNCNQISDYDCNQKKSSDLALELENAVANNIPCEIITPANEGANVNGLTQSNEGLVHLAVRSESMSSIATLGFLKADLDVLNAAGATPMEEAIKIDSVPSIKELISAGANIEKQLSVTLTSMLLLLQARMKHCGSYLRQDLNPN